MNKIKLLLLAIVLFSCKQENTAPVDKNKTVITIDYTSDVKPDSIVVTEKECIHWHSFKGQEKVVATFNKKVPHIYLIAFYANGKHYSNEFWLDNGNPQVKLHLANKEVVIDTVYNAPVYYEFAAFFKQLDAFDKSKDSLKRDKYLLDKIDAHFDDCFSNIVSANYMIYHQNNIDKLRILEDKIKNQNDSIKYGYMSDYGSLQNWLTPKKFNLSDYKLIDTKGVAKKPDTSNSKLYLIDFWFVNCPPCVADHKIINQRLNDFKNHNIEVVGISRDESYDKWSNYLEKHNYDWKNYKQIYPEKNIPTENLGITAYPTYLIINSKGDILKRYSIIKDVVADYLDKK